MSTQASMQLTAASVGWDSATNGKPATFEQKIQFFNIQTDESFNSETNSVTIF
jgi:hypothetical protein